MKYSWKMTGIGQVDNLGQQFAKVMRGMRQGSIETKYRYAEAGRRFVSHVGQKFGLQKIQNISDKHLASYARHLKELGRADKYIKTELSAIRSLHRQIPQAKFQLADGTKFNREIGLGSTPDGRGDRAWTEAEIKGMQRIANDLDRPEIARAIEAARSTGMRIDEMASLKRHEVEAALRTGNLCLTNTKGGRPRSIPLSERARKCLVSAIKDVPRGGYVFTPDGVKVHEFKSQIEDFVYNHRDKVQEPDRHHSGHNIATGERGALTYHGLRHSFARERFSEIKKDRIADGWSVDRAHDHALQTVAHELGHNRQTVTNIYLGNG